MDEQAPCNLVIGMDFITWERLSLIPSDDGLEIWDEK